MARFERGGSRKAEDDNYGSVRIQVKLLNNKSRPIPRNICRSLTVKNAKVSEVTEAIVDSLFGEEGD